MKIRKTMAVAMAILALAGCKPDGGSKAPGGGSNGGGGDGNGGGPAAGAVLDREYRVQLNGMDDERRKIRRGVTCVIDAQGADGQTINITDARTGATTPGKSTVKVNSQQRLLLQVWANVVYIVVECTMRGQVGDSLSCEFLDSRGGHAALEAGHKEFQVIEEEDDGEAQCYGIILVTR